MSIADCRSGAATNLKLDGGFGTGAAPRVWRGGWFSQLHDSNLWHDWRTRPSVHAVRLFAILVLCAFPCAAAAQPWADAYRSGDYKKAADLLHPMIIEQGYEQTFADGTLTRHLAQLYARGLGVERDAVAACALAQMSDVAAHMSAPQYSQNPFAYEDSLKESQRFVGEHCDRLEPPARLAAGRSMGCFAFGMPEEAFTLGGRTVWVGRGGIRLAETPDEKFAPDLGCPQFVARVRPLTIAPPTDPAPGIGPRHFVELLAWQVGKPRDSTLRYFLQWRLYELRGNSISVIAMEHVDSSNGWPNPALPPDFDARFTLEMIRSGHVRWRMAGAPPKRGWVMLPEKDAR